MASETDFPARGKVTRVMDDAVVFAPANTTYELTLRTPVGRYDGPVNTLVDVVIRGVARKLYTVPSGGAFVTPIQGPPRIVQGRVRHIEGRYVVLQAGTTVLVRFPEDGKAIDLATGPVRIGALVNAVLLPGSTLELLGAVVPA
jgi:hypothetical protein